MTSGVGNSASFTTSERQVIVGLAALRTLGDCRGWDGGRRWNELDCRRCLELACRRGNHQVSESAMLCGSRTGRGICVGARLDGGLI